MMFHYFTKAARLQRLEITLAGKEAQMAVCRELYSLAQRVPTRELNRCLRLAEDIGQLKVKITFLRDAVDNEATAQ